MKIIFKLLQRVLREKRGNVLMLTGFSIIPLVGATGMGIDYARAARTDTKLSAAADAAALSAVSQPMMLKTEAEAKAYARQIFNQQAALIPDLIYDPNDLSQLDVRVEHVGVAIEDRKVTVLFNGQSRNMFGSILGLSTLQVGGISISKAARAPNIDFYLVLDTSPSMALPTTDQGADDMYALVGCRFACHTNKPDDHGINIFDTTATGIVKNDNTNLGDGKTRIHTDGTYTKSGRVYNSNGTYVDSYWLARNKGILLRIDAERIAAANLMAVARTVSTESGATYKAALFTFDYRQNFKTIAPLTANLESVAADASSVKLLKINTWNGTGGCPSPTADPLFCNNYLETSYTGALIGANSAIPNPGNGTSQAGDTPQKILFIVTDGVSDEAVTGISRTRSEMHSSHITRCNAIKARGIRIAILYTEYTAKSIENDGAQGAAVTARLPFVAPKLTACASPGLMYTVRTNEDISAALTALFRQATTTAHLRT